MRNSSQRTIVFSLTFTAIGFFSGFANAGVIVLRPAIDQTIGDSNLDGIPDGTLSVTDGYLRSGFFSTHWRSALEFNLASLPPLESTVLNANLFLADRGSSRNGQMNLWGYAGNGAIELGDALETSNLLAQFTIEVLSGAQDFNLDVTSFLQTAVTGGFSHAGFLIGADTPTGFGGAATDMGSNEAFGGDADRPTLTITTATAAVPEPSSIVLFGGIALVGLANRRRRNHAQAITQK